MARNGSLAVPVFAARAGLVQRILQDSQPGLQVRKWTDNFSWSANDGSAMLICTWQHCVWQFESCSSAAAMTANCISSPLDLGESQHMISDWTDRLIYVLITQNAGHGWACMPWLETMLLLHGDSCAHSLVLWCHDTDQSNIWDQPALNFHVNTLSLGRLVGMPHLWSIYSTLHTMYTMQGSIYIHLHMLCADLIMHRACWSWR